MHRRISAVSALLAAVTASALLVGCSSSGGSPLVPDSSAASAPSSDTAKGVAPDTSAPTTAASTPTPVAPTTSASTRASTPPPGLRDFSDVTFAVPSGFQVSGEYSPLTPLESDYVSHFVVPTDSTNTKEVIGMYVYALPAAKTVTAKTDQVSLIKAYNAKAKAKVSGTIHRATSAIDGLPAYSETATEPGDYTYIAYWAFGTHHFFLYSCQLGSASSVATLAVACGTTLASLQLT